MKTVRLGDVCTARSSLVDPTDERFRDLPHVAPDSIERDSGRLLRYRTVAEDGVTSGKPRFESGDVLYSKIRPNLNKVTLIDFEGLCSADMYALKVDPNAMSAEFLVYALRSRRFLDYATSLSNRANIPKLNRNQLMGWEFELPTLPEQRRIAAILDHADALRAKRRQVLAHLDTLAQSIFHDMFGAGMDGARVELKDAIRWSSGKFLPAKDQRGGPFPVFGGNGVNGYHDRNMFEERRLVVGRVGAYCGAVHLTPPNAWVTDNALVATVKVDGLTLDYLLPALTLANLNQFAGVSGQPSISAGKIGHVQIPLPSLAMQTEFARRIDAVNAQHITVLTAQRADDELFASLQSRAFRGDL